MPLGCHPGLAGGVRVCLASADVVQTLARPNHDNGACSVIDHERGHAAQKEAPERTAVVTADHDDAGTFSDGRLDY